VQSPARAFGPWRGRSRGDAGYNFEIEAGRPFPVRLRGAALQIADLREFAAVVAGKKAPDFSVDHALIVQEALLRASGMVGQG
jgi:hypothetical protein